MNQEEINKEEKKESGTVKSNNPYRDRVHLHPECLFNFLDAENDRKNLAKLVDQHSEIYCELGSGSGGHLIERASQNKKGLFVGFEIRFKRAVRTIEKAKESGLSNVCVIRCDARNFGMYFGERKVNGIYVNFPDPWQKRRFHKHRLLSSGLLDSAKAGLVEGGFLAIKTDYRETYLEMVEALEQDSAFEVVEKSLDLKNSEYEEKNVATEFELMFRSQGLPINYVKTVKRVGP